MKNRICLVLFLIAVAIFLLWLLKNPVSTVPVKEQTVAAQTNGTVESSLGNVSVAPPMATQPPDKFQSIAAHTEQIKQGQDQETSLWQSPLLYYGKVIDENNQPISGVQVSYNASALDASKNEIQNTGTVSTDERGIFKIDGVNGVGLMLEISHPSYYPFPDNSTGFDKRSLPRIGYFSDSEDKAEIFRMHSKGHPVPLIFRSGGLHASNDGTVANFPLRGSTRAEILGQLQVQGWSGIRSETNAYDWEVRLNAPAGGIIETTNYFDFVAPESGYADSVNFEVAGSEMARKTYFLKLPTGYIRLKLEVIMGKDMFVSGNYYFNPDGSQNLEPGDVIRPTQ